MRPLSPIPAERGPLRGERALRTVAWTTVVVFAGGTLPTPLYLLYQQHYGFSDIELTLIFAAWVLGTASALLFLGRLPDQIGRRHSALPAIALAAASTVVFLLQDAPALLYLARFLSGLATGLYAAAATPWMVELEPQGDARRAARITAASSNLGLGLGPLLAGGIVSVGTRPLELPFVAYLALLIGTAALGSTRGTVTPRLRSLEQLDIEPEARLPTKVRGRFAAPAAAGFCAFAVTGFYSALAPALLSRDLYRPGALRAGVVVLTCFASAALVSLLSGRIGSARAMRLGLILILPTVGVLVASRELGSIVLLYLDAVLAGSASALATRGSLEVLTGAAEAAQRARVSAAYYLVCYAGVALPIVGLGILTVSAGNAVAMRVFAAVIGSLALGGLAIGQPSRR